MTHCLTRWALTAAAVAFAADLPAEPPIRMIAHRGGVVTEEIIENNRGAIAAAVQRGYWMVEVDVRASLDAIPIVHHDADFKRYYGDPRQVSEMTGEEISRLRSRPGNEQPLTLAQYVEACDGRLRIMLDVKGQDFPPAYLQAIEDILRQHDQLATAYIIGAEAVKQHLLGKARIGRPYDQILAARERGEDIASRYFLFPRGLHFQQPEVDRALELGVPVVPSINKFHYLGFNHLERAKQDILRLRRAGVNIFQIDSVYDVWLRDPS